MADYSKKLKSIKVDYAQSNTLSALVCYSILKSMKACYGKPYF